MSSICAVVIDLQCAAAAAASAHARMRLMQWLYEVRASLFTSSIGHFAVQFSLLSFAMVTYNAIFGVSRFV